MKRVWLFLPAALGLATLISALATISVGPVRAGTPLSSVPVRDVESGARDPINVTGEFVIHDGSLGIEAGFPGLFGTVPVGKRLVIETVTAFADLPPNQRPILRIRTDQFPGFRSDLLHLIPFTQERLFDRVHMEACRQVRLYADSGNSLKIAFDREGGITGEAFCLVTISGYFVTI